jgi:CBS domain containing-hemolysin-like protein
MNDWSGILWLVILLISNAFFVGSEFAVIAARRAQIEPLAQEGNKAAKVTLKAMEQVSLMLATAQLGITVSSILILVVAEPSIQRLMMPLFELIGVDYQTGYTLSFLVALVLVTYLHVVFGEMIPKNLAIAIPDRMSLILAPMLYGVSVAFRPIVLSLNLVSNVILRLLGVTPRDEANTAFTLDQVEDIVETSTREGVLSDTSGTLSNTFDFTEKKVGDIYWPMEKLIVLDQSSAASDVQQAVAKHGFSRYPLSESGRVVGYIHVKDILELERIDASIPKEVIRPMVSLPESMDLEDALASMRKSGAHIARTFNSTGELTGALFLEDIIEELVGEIRDATQRD